MPERIVFLAQGFSEPGGCAAHGRKLAEELAGRGFEVSVIARKGTGRSFRRTRVGRLRVLEVPGFSNRAAGALLYLAVALPLTLLRRAPTAFIGFQLSATASVASVGASVHRRRLLVFSTMTGERGEVAFVRASPLAPARRALLGRASVLVAQTAEGAVELSELLPGARVEVIPTPIRLPADVPPLSGGPTVAFSGRLVAQKNLLVLIAAWRAVLAELPEARLTLIGSGIPGDPTEAEIRAALASEPALAASIEITGWVQDVASRLAAADVYAFPSAYEGMSNALLEACALGRVPVASAIGANRAVLGDDYPLLVASDDAAGLAAALIRALSDAPLRAELREWALRRAARSDLTVVGAEIERLIRG